MVSARFPRPSAAWVWVPSGYARRRSQTVAPPVTYFLHLQPSQRDVLHVAAGFLADPPRASHTVQFYEDEAFLFETVARFASAGLEAGDRVLLIVTSEHAQGILGQLDPERVARALRERQLSVVDARTMLDSLLVEDMPDARRFEAALKPLLEAPSAGPARPLRAFGELVDVLWRAGNP